MGNILICDDERSICEMLDIALRREGYKVETVNSGEAAKRKIDGALYDVIVTDIKMPGITGIEVLRYAHGASPDSAIILITAVDDYEAAVQAVKAGGAADYIRKGPGLVDEIKLAINRALEKQILSKQNFALRRDGINRGDEDIGYSVAIHVTCGHNAALIGRDWRQDGRSESSRPIPGKHGQLRLASAVTGGKQDVQLVIPVEVPFGQHQINATRGKVEDLGLNELGLNHSDGQKE